MSLQPDNVNVNKPMRVALLEVRGTMSSVYLPSKQEGRYRFANQEGKASDIPLSIVFESGHWMLKGTNGIRIYRDETDLGEQAVISKDCLLGVSYAGKQYIVYTEEENDNDSVFIPYVIPELSDITIGREPNNTIVYINSYVSRNHARLYSMGGQLHIRDEQSTNGTFVNGQYVRECALNVGDVVYIMGLYILVGCGFVCINNATNRVQITGNMIYPVQSAAELHIAEESKCTDEDNLFDRLPRRKYKLESEKIEVNGPPTAAGGSKGSLLLKLGNPAVSGGRAIISGNYMMALSSMVLPLMNQGLSDKERKEYDELRLIKYREYLEKKEAELYAERDREERILNEIYPPLGTVLDYAHNTERLWERRYVDDDFLNVRVGTGKLRLQAEVEYPKEQFALEPDMLNEEMLELVKKDYSMNNAPAMLSLRKDFITGVVGAPMYTQYLCANMMLNLCFTHSYDEVKLIILGDAKDTSYIREEMDCLRYVPHCWDDLKDHRFIADDKASACVIGEYLKKQLEDLLAEQANGKVTKKSFCPSYVIFAFNKELLDCIEVIKDLFDAGQYLGVSIVTAYGNPPKECTALIRMEKRTGSLIDLGESSENDIVFKLEKCDKEAEKESLRTLMHTKLKTAGRAFDLPKTYTFMEMFNAGKVEYLNPLQRWKNSNPTKSLAAEIGIGTDGEKFYLDLHQKRQGPHGLVAGMTGSGKSEFIITYILSLAVNYSPDEVAFVLIDYKGGGLATAFDDPKRDLHLPHVVGTITNLDGAAIQRSLTSIESELKRRQAVFNVAKTLNNEGTMDIYDYQKLYRAGKVPEPMPHLFLISDEFAELKSQQPEFMDALISTARIGRSLGVHLILATQKPSGVVNDQIWSNTKFRVCLKVQDKSDSTEMIKRPEAAALKETGRFYLQVGYNEYFALGQSAWCGADYIPQEEAVSQTDESVDFLDTAGQIVLNAKPKKKTVKSETKQLVAIVQYLSDLAKEEHILPKRLWMDPLPEKLEYDSVIDRFSVDFSGKVCALIGTADDPERQRQLPYILDFGTFKHMLICGTSGTGKSMFLRTMLYSLVSNYSPEDVCYYILDLSGGALNGFKTLPHCGAYLTDNDENDFKRTVELLKQIAKDRKHLFEEMDVTNFEAYRQVKKMAHILFIIDSYSNITNFSCGSNFNIYLNELLRELAPYGIHVILTTNHLNEVSAKGRGEVDYHVALQAKDKYDYGEILGARIKNVPPVMNGTGYCIIEDNVMEYHVAMPDSQMNDRDRAAALKERIALLDKEYAGCEKAESLAVIDESMTYPEHCKAFAPGRIPLGYNRDTAGKVAIPLKQLHNIGYYFGSPKVVKPVLSNLLYAAQMNGMPVTVMTRTSGSLFSTKQEGDLRAVYTENIDYLGCTADDVLKLYNMLSDEIAARNVFRDKFCEEHGLPNTDKGRILKAAGYVAQNTKPHLFIIESMADLCKSGVEKGYLDAFQLIFEGTRGYNMYFAGLFYPEDQETVSGNSVVKSFCKEQFLLMFGGKFDRIIMTQLTNEMRSSTKEFPDSTKYVMKYRDDYYRMHMPCGTEKNADEDPDDAPIV